MTLKPMKGLLFAFPFLQMKKSKVKASEVAKPTC